MNSKQLVQQVLPGWTGKLAAHHIGYLGDGHVHRAVPYTATDPKVIAAKLGLMQADGVDVVIETWQGPWATSCNQDAITTSQMCAKLGMEFALLLDPGGMQKWQSGLTEAQITANVVAALTAPTTVAMLNNPAYVTNKYILDFNTGANLVQLAADFPSYKFLAQGAGFSWIAIPPTSITDSPAKNAWAVANLAAQHANPAMTIASFCAGFNDSGMPLPQGVQSQATFDADGGVRDLTQSVWGGPARILESFAGMFSQQQIATINPTTPIVAILTWDDYDEQSSGPREKVLAETSGINWSSL